MPLPDINDPATLEEQQQQFVINQEAIDKVSRRLWKTQGGVYGNDMKSKEYAKLSIREKVELRMK